MQRSCAHRWNPRGSSWTGPSPDLTSGPWPRLTAAGGAHRRPPGRNQTLTQGTLMTRNGKIARRAASLRQDFIHEGYDGSIKPELTRQPDEIHLLQFRSIQVN